MPRKYLKGRKPIKKKKSKAFKVYALIFLLIIIVTAIYIIYNLDRRAMPVVVAATEIHANTIVNAAINESLRNIIERENLITEDFYYRTISGDRISAVGVNTVLVNEICNEIAFTISESLNNMGRQRVNVPLGAVFGMSIFANSGPRFPVSVTPMGEAVVDFESSFQNAGINQVNFQLWLNVETRVQIVNPMQETYIIIERKISIVNTVISGEVPPTYLNFDR
ncbi:MAG: sporulation protein YunB [Defluviitaleaceae bacterium]|nr:sporulation protein YunB [Defluviitaleaceae bacterium]